MGSSCSLCGAEIRWVRTVYGKNLPLDVEPSRYYDHGNFTLDESSVAHYVDNRRRVELLDAGEPVWLAHFATCSMRKR